MALAVASAVIMPWYEYHRPYLFVGLGIKRYNYSNFADELEDVLSDIRTAGTLRMGMGLFVSRRLRLEISDNISRQSFSFEVPEMVKLKEPVRTLNDISVSLGYRVGRL
ncbi:MAG: hypothetical protein WD342_05560 [Verrucomicrobiales bacterium]